MKLAGMSLLLAAVGFIAVFSVLAGTFDYPDILDRSAAEVLPRLLALGTPGRAVWAFYAFVPLMLVPAAAGLATFHAASEHWECGWGAGMSCSTARHSSMNRELSWVLYGRRNECGERRDQQTSRCSVGPFDVRTPLVTRSNAPLFDNVRQRLSFGPSATTTVR